jgi:hypothetical protein
MMQPYQFHTLRDRRRPELFAARHRRGRVRTSVTG